MVTIRFEFEGQTLVENRYEVVPRAGEVVLYKDKKYVVGEVVHDLKTYGDFISTTVRLGRAR